MQSTAQTVDEYIESLPPDRRHAIGALRDVICRNLPQGYEEGMQYGMIGYYIPLSRYPNTYNGQALSYVGLASQKNYMSLYLMGVYGDEERERWFREAFASRGKKLNMGKSCVRFKKLEDLPLDVIGEAIAQISVDDYLRWYEASRKKG